MVKALIGAILFLILCRSSSRAVPNGEIDASDQYTDVVRLRGEHTLCSGILLSQRTILTAGHCIRREGRYLYEGMTAAHISSRGTQQANVLKAALPDKAVEALDRWIPPKGQDIKQMFFKSSVEFRAKVTKRDLAILTLDSDLPFAGNFRPVWDILSREAIAGVPRLHPFITFADFQELKSKTRYASAGREAIVVGFGATACDGDDERSCEGFGTTRRFAKAEALGTRFCVDTQDPNYFSYLRGGVCIVSSKEKRAPATLPGDSGGPIFIIGKNDRLYLIGVISNGGKRSAFGESFTAEAASSILEHIDFIKANTQGEWPIPEATVTDMRRRTDRHKAGQDQR
jgi:hypothetical protein